MLRANINMETVTKECCLKTKAKLFDYAYLKRCRTWLLVSEGLYMSEFNPIWRKFGHPIWTLHSYLKEIWKKICQSIFQPCASFFLFASSNMFILTPPINANLTHSQLSPSSGTFRDLLCPICLTWSPISLKHTMHESHVKIWCLIQCEPELLSHCRSRILSQCENVGWGKGCWAALL